MALKKTSLKARYILVTTTDLEVLKSRLHKRQLGSMGDEVDLQKWIEKARDDQYKSEFEKTIINDDLEKAYQELKEYCLQVYWNDFDLYE